MDQAALSRISILETLLKTNRPPTDQEKAIIQESMAPTNAKLKVVEAQISDTMAHIQALKSQVEQAEIKLQRLREEEAAILETSADQRRVLSSPFRNLPEDVLREICVACVEVDMPTLSYYRTPLPYTLAQISSGMRHIALTTPFIWASMRVELGLSVYFDSLGEYEKAYSILAQRARKWFKRAGRLALTIFIDDTCSTFHSYTAFKSSEADPSSILFDTLLSYSARWKEIQFNSSCYVVPTPLLRIAALTAVDVPLLQSVSLLQVPFDCFAPNPVLHNSVLLTIPTLKHVKLVTGAVPMLTVNWAILTSVTLRGRSDWFCYKSEMARILHQTKCLVFCDIAIGPDRMKEHYPNKINLPFLKTLIVHESTSETASSGDPTILDMIAAPILEIFHIRRALLDLSLPGFFQRSPRIWKLSLPYSKKDESLMDTIGFLRHCPSLTALSLRPRGCGADIRDGNRFLQAFVEEGDAGVICPRLQYFDFRGNIDFSLQTLRLFLEGKQGDIATLNVLPWKKVVVDIDGIKAKETRRQVLDLVSQKKAAGLDVEAKQSPYK